MLRNKLTVLAVTSKLIAESLFRDPYNYISLIKLLLGSGQIIINYKESKKTRKVAFHNLKKTISQK